MILKLKILNTVVKNFNDQLDQQVITSKVRNKKSFVLHGRLWETSGYLATFVITKEITVKNFITLITNLQLKSNSKNLIDFKRIMFMVYDYKG